MKNILIALILFVFAFNTHAASSTYIKGPQLVESNQTALSSGTPIALTATSPMNLYITGTAAQTVNLPSVSTIAEGSSYKIYNKSTQAISVKDFLGGAIGSVFPNTDKGFTLFTGGLWVESVGGSLGKTLVGSAPIVITQDATTATISVDLSSKEDTANKSATTTLGTSDVLFPTQNAVKTYVDTIINGFSSDNEVVVSSTRGCDTSSCDGSVAKPFKSISYAIAHAKYATSGYDQAASLVQGTQYRIDYIGTTDFTLLGAASNTVGLWFTKNATLGSGTGLASPQYLNEQLTFKVESGFYDESVSVPIFYRRKIVIIGSGVIINGSVTVVSDITGTVNNKPAFALVGVAGAYIEANLTQGIAVAGDLVFTGTGVNNSNIFASIYNVGLRGNLIVNNGQPNISLSNVAMEKPDGSIGYVFSNRTSSSLNIFNSKMQSTICGIWNFGIIENARIYKVDYSIDNTGSAFAGKIIGITGAAYMGGFRNSRFVATGNKFGTNTVGANSIYFDSNSYQSLLAIGSYTMSNISAGLIDNAKGVAFTPTISGNWTTTPTTTQAALDELATKTGGKALVAGNGITIVQDSTTATISSSGKALVGSSPIVITQDATTSTITLDQSDLVHKGIEETISASKTFSAYINIGDPTVDGSYRFYKSGGALIYQKRVSGSWLETYRVE